MLPLAACPLQSRLVARLILMAQVPAQPLMLMLTLPAAPLQQEHVTQRPFAQLGDLLGRK